MPHSPTFETPAERAARLNRERVNRCREKKRGTERPPACNGPGNAVMVGTITAGSPSDSPSDCVCVSSSAGKEGRKDTHTPSSLPREGPLHGNGVTVPVMPASITPLQPPQTGEEGFDAFWAAWCAAVPPNRRTDREGARAAWIAQGHAADPERPLRRLTAWAREDEWKVRKCYPSAATFLSKPKFMDEPATAPIPKPAARLSPDQILRLLPDAPAAVRDAAADELLAGWADRGGRVGASARQQINEARGEWPPGEWYAKQLIGTQAVRVWAQGRKR